jgi:hypothetical protein
MRQHNQPGDFPLLIEAKSAGDFTNTNKRRKEEAVKIQQLRKTYGDKITFDLFLCGYFDSGYLGMKQRKVLIGCGSIGLMIWQSLGCKYERYGKD